MNWRKKHKENTKLLRRYLDFLNEVADYDERLKLCVEISRLQLQNKEIELFPFHKIERSEDFFTIQIPSNL